MNAKKSRNRKKRGVVSLPKNAQKRHQPRRGDVRSSAPLGEVVVTLIYCR